MGDETKEAARKARELLALAWVGIIGLFSSPFLVWRSDWFVLTTILGFVCAARYVYLTLSVKAVGDSLGPLFWVVAALLAIGVLMISSSRDSNHYGPDADYMDQFNLP